jgi:hypothetical protein
VARRPMDPKQKAARRAAKEAATAQNKERRRVRHEKRVAKKQAKLARLQSLPDLDTKASANTDQHA